MSDAAENLSKNELAQVVLWPIPLNMTTTRAWLWLLEERDRLRELHFAEVRKKIQGGLGQRDGAKAFE